jgi:hypothetical protein
MITQFFSQLATAICVRSAIALSVVVGPTISLSQSDASSLSGTTDTSHTDLSRISSSWAGAASPMVSVASMPTVPTATPTRPTDTPTTPASLAPTRVPVTFTPTPKPTSTRAAVSKPTSTKSAAVPLQSQPVTWDESYPATDALKAQVLSDYAADQQAFQDHLSDQSYLIGHAATYPAGNTVAERTTNIQMAFAGQAWLVGSLAEQPKPSDSRYGQSFVCSFTRDGKTALVSDMTQGAFVLHHPRTGETKRTADLPLFQFRWILRSSPVGHWDIVGFEGTLDLSKGFQVGQPYPFANIPIHRTGRGDRPELRYQAAVGQGHARGGNSPVRALGLLLPDHLRLIG